MAKKMSIAERMLKKSSNPFAAKILDCELYNVDTYYDTGNYMLNLLLSGKIRGGIPAGKIIEFSGDSQTGKTFLIMNCLYEFLKGKKNHVLLFESEGSLLNSELKKRINEDENERFLVFPISHHEELGRNMAEQIEMIDELKKEDPEYNFMVCVDSLGMLTPKAQYENTLKGKETKIMTEQSLIKSFFNMIKIPFAKHNVPFLYTNHIYLNFMANTYGHVPEYKKKITRGGQGVEYSPDIKLRFEQKDLREVDGVGAKDMYVNKSNDQLNNITGVKVYVIPTKHRLFAKNISKIELNIRFKLGMDKFSGDFEFLTTHNLTERTVAGQKGSRIYIPEIDYEFFTGDLKGMSKEEFWNDTLLNYIEKKFNEFYLLESQKDTTIESELLKEEVKEEK